MREGIAYTAFTDRGRALAEKLKAQFGGSLRGEEQPLAAWVGENFRTRAALVFIGAAGIAVRSVAPCINSKASDPAVLCVDETGRWVIPLLSGHLGGANALAKKMADYLEGEAVITTATDLNGLFAVDLWARRQGLAIPEPGGIKAVSAKLLRGEGVMVSCPVPIRGAAPRLVSQGEAGEVRVDYRPGKAALTLVPRVLTLGVGCKRGTTAEVLEAAFREFCDERNILPQAVERAASIDRKRDEAGLLAFCEGQGWEISFFSADELKALGGGFTGSDFVKAQVGVDNVCERAAVLASGGHLIEQKFARGGVTFALAVRAWSLNWRWQDGDTVCDRSRAGEA